MGIGSAKSFFLGISRFLAFLMIPAGLAAVASAQTPVTIYNFNMANGNVGSPKPFDIAVQGRDGNLYSTTNAGGSGQGGVYVVTPTGTEKRLHDFPTGSYCNSGLTLGSDGNFYGACTSLDESKNGYLYKVTPTGSFTTLYKFTDANGDGARPQAPPIQATDGNYYGTTQSGGANGNGAVYKLTPNGTVTILYSFADLDASPTAPLVQGTDGNLYGSAPNGGSNRVGTIFKISTAGKYTLLHTFDLTDGGYPTAALIQASDGSFYGTTLEGGANSDGTVFKITASGKFTLLHSFSLATDGNFSETALLQATDGNLYGTTNNTGDYQNTIYKITPKGVFSIVYQFDGTSATVGASPANALVQHTNGLLYGATTFSSSTNAGDSGTIYTLNIGAKPFARLTLTSGLVGSSVSIFGQGFSGSSVVKFDGVQATGVTRQGATYITVPVPSGALTGNVTVTTGSTTLTSNQIFKVTPTVTSFTPAQGPVGTSVVITGVSLTQATAVTFGGVKATTFTVNSDTQITATVPAGAKTGKVMVTTKGGSSSSPTKYTVE
jgi:uncharacterized repeat protein (TIGR03803 family)